MAQARGADALDGVRVGQERIAVHIASLRSLTLSRLCRVVYGLHRTALGTDP